MKREDFNQAILNTFNNMKEGVEYTLNQESFDRISAWRSQNGYSAILKNTYRFKRLQHSLYFSADAGKSYKDVVEISDKCLDLTFAEVSYGIMVAGPLSLVLAFAFNELEPIDSCEGKIVEIDGKKYKLQLV